MGISYHSLIVARPLRQGAWLWLRRPSSSSVMGLDLGLDQGMEQNATESLMTNKNAKLCLQFQSSSPHRTLPHTNMPTMSLLLFSYYKRKTYSL